MTGVGTLINIALAFGWLSLFAVGGAAAAIPEIHRIAVDLNHWMTDTQFAARQRAVRSAEVQIKLAS